VRLSSSLAAAGLLLLSACGGGGGGGGTSISVTPKSMNFTVQNAGYSPASQLVTAKYKGAAILVGYPLDEPEAPWLAIEYVNETSSEGTYRVHVAYTDLPPGNYTSRLRFVTGNADGSDIDYEDMAIALTITGPALAVSTTDPTADFVAAANGALPPSQTFTIDYNGDALVPPSVPAWLSLTTVATRPGSTDYKLDVVGSNYSPNSHLADALTFRTTRAGGLYSRAAVVSVGYDVVQPLALTPGTNTYSYVEGSGVDPTPSNRSLTIASGFPYWTASSNQPWLQLAAAAGSSAGALGFTIDESQLALGANTATVTVQIAATQETKTSTITVNARAPRATVTGNAAFAVNGQTTPAQAVKELTISDEAAGNGAQTVTWSVGTISVPWLSATPSAGNTDVPDTLELHLVPAELGDVANGNHAATVTLNYTNGDGAGSLEIPVSLALTLPRLQYVAPYVALENHSDTVVLRGEYLDAVPSDGMTLDGAVVEFTPVSATELRLTHAALAAGNYPIATGNALGIPPDTVGLVVKAAPAYGASSIASPHRKKRIVNDVERGIVYAVDEEDRDLERYRLVDGVWVGERINTAPVTVNDLALSPDGKTLVLLSDAALYEADASQYPLSFTARAYPGTINGASHYFTYGSLAPLNDGRIAVVGGSQWTWGVLYDLRTQTITGLVGNNAVFYGGYAFASPGGNLAMLKEGNGIPGFFNASTSQWQFVNMQYYGQHFAMSRFAERMVYGCYGVLNADASQLLGKVEGRQWSCVVSRDGTRVYSWYRSTETGPGEVRVYDLTATTDLNGFFPVIQTLTLPEDPGAYYANDLSMLLAPGEESLLIFGNARFMVVPLP
jgi:hypothetical protein